MVFVEEGEGEKGYWMLDIGFMLNKKLGLGLVGEQRKGNDGVCW